MTLKNFTISYTLKNFVKFSTEVQPTLVIAHAIGYTVGCPHN